MSILWLMWTVGGLVTLTGAIVGGVIGGFLGAHITLRRIRRPTPRRVSA